MKKSLVVLLLLFLSWSVLEAKPGLVSVGLKGGFNLANISVSPAPTEISRFSNLGGLTWGIFVSLGQGFLAIQPEFLFARRGTKYQAFIDDNFYRVEWQHNYLEALLLLKWWVLNSGPVRPFILAGPSYGRLSKAKSVVLDSLGKEIAAVDTKEYFRKDELAVVMGTGLEFKVSRLKLSLEVRYHLGLSNVALSGQGVDYIKNKSLSILGGFSF